MCYMYVGTTQNGSSSGAIRMKKINKKEKKITAYRYSGEESLLQMIMWEIIARDWDIWEGPK